MVTGRSTPIKINFWLERPVLDMYQHVTRKRLSHIARVRGEFLAWFVMVYMYFVYMLLTLFPTLFNVFYFYHFLAHGLL